LSIVTALVKCCEVAISSFYMKLPTDRYTDKHIDKKLIRDRGLAEI